MCWKLLLLLSFRTSQHPKKKKRRRRRTSCSLSHHPPTSIPSQDGMRETESEEGQRTRTITDRPKSTSAQSVLAMLKYVVVVSGMQKNKKKI